LISDILLKIKGHISRVKRKSVLTASYLRYTVTRASVQTSNILVSSQEKKPSRDDVLAFCTGNWKILFYFDAVYQYTVHLN